MSVVCRDQVVAGPDEPTVFDESKNVRAILASPSGEIFIGHVGGEMGEAAGSASPAGNIRRFHED